MGRLKKVSAPTEELKDFANLVDRNLETLDSDSHEHTPGQTAPGPNDWYPGKILPVGDYLYVKKTNGKWVRFAGTEI